MVDIAPVDRIMYAVCVDNEFVVGRTAGELSGRDGQSSGVCEDSLAVPDGLFDEDSRTEISPDD